MFYLGMFAIIVGGAGLAGGAFLWALTEFRQVGRQIVFYGLVAAVFGLAPVLLLRPPAAIDAASQATAAEKPQPVSGPTGNVSVDNAFLLCGLLDSTGMLTDRCSVSGWNSSVDASLDMTAAEARKACIIITNMATKSGIRFGYGWSVRIYSPFSGGNPIAYCYLA